MPSERVQPPTLNVRHFERREDPGDEVESSVGVDQPLSQKSKDSGIEIFCLCIYLFIYLLIILFLRFYTCYSATSNDY